MIKIASAHLWVHDQEVALKYWTEKVGMEVRQDVSLPDLDDTFRWLTVGPPGQDDVSIVLMAVPGEPVMDEATQKQVMDLTAKGFAGTVFLTTENCQASHEEMKARGLSSPRTLTRCRMGSTAGSVIRPATACDSPNWRRSRPILGRCELPPLRSARRPSLSWPPARSLGWAPG